MDALNSLATHAVVLAMLLAGILTGPLIAVGAMRYRKHRARALRRSPIGIDLLRPPGHTLREQMDEALDDYQACAAVLFLVPSILIAIVLAQAHLLGVERVMSGAPIYALFVISALAYAIHRLWHLGQRMDRLRAGHDAEVAVGQELDQLMREGAAVFHDLPADGFNIDHVVISRRGVFAVETKGYTKAGDQRGKAAATVVFDGRSLAFPRWTTVKPIEQAERQATWLSAWLESATGEPVGVLPVVALPGWFVDRQGRGAVRVYSGRELGQLLMAVGAPGLSEAAMQRVVHQVEGRCRDVGPRLRKDG